MRLVHVPRLVKVSPTILRSRERTLLPVKEVTNGFVYLHPVCTNEQLWMASTSKKALTRAEVGLLQLKNCLVNLPRSLVVILLNAQTVGIVGCVEAIN